jgi:hypothetical protein
MLSLVLILFFFFSYFPAETPATATERIRFQDTAIRERKPKEIKITWEKQNLTTNFDAQIQISLYGYREVTIAPELVFIDVIAVNDCLYSVYPTHIGFHIVVSTATTCI